MPATDEDFVRDLMHRATGDLHAPPAVTAGIVTRHRRHQRTRVLAYAAAGTAAATAVAVAVATTGTAGPAPTQVGHATHVTLTAAQRTLVNLSVAASAAGQPAGRYVVMKELAGKDKKTTIVNLKTGDAWTYQSGRGIPHFFYSPHGVADAASFAAYPTALPALHTLLIKQAREQQRQAIRFELKAARIKDKGHVAQIRRELLASMRKQTTSDLVFAQAAYLLWNPVIGPDLRAALLKLLAATPGVLVNSHATDSVGRPAVEISRYDKADNYTQAIFEAPDASTVLETSSIHPATPAANGLPAEAAYQLSDTYLSISYTDTRPRT